MEIEIRDGTFKLTNKGKTILSDSKDFPMIYVGYGVENVDMYRGNYKIEDYVVERIPLNIIKAEKNKDGYTLNFEDRIEGTISTDGDLAQVSFMSKDPKINRFWIRVNASRKEHCYGCGEQMSYFDLRGRHYPIWTSEPGVGRDKTTYVTWRSDVENKGGGDYYNTNFPQPTFVSSDHYYLHVDSTTYADFDFRNEFFHEIQIWEVPKNIRIEAAETFAELLEKETAYFGRQPMLPDWVYDGLIFGVQGGSERSFGLADKIIDRGVKVSGIWCQDWCGKKVTSFGKRLKWDWQYHKTMYPQLPDEIKKLHERGIRFLGYINPYLVNDGELYKEGKEKGYFATKSDGSDYLVDFGEFYCGVVDFTNPEAFEWFKKDVIEKYSLDIGIDGWMADFGEYLPTDVKLANGEAAMKEHNHWPVLWAKCNYEALKDRDAIGKVVYFMRAGGTNSQRYCTLLWAGDQSVDFSRHDGLCTVINAALSSGMMGMGLSHSDIGGYTSLFGNDRTKEVFLRWAEMAMFTPVMRTHEGNRPDENFQFYDDEDCIKQMSRLVDIYTMLKPYIKDAVKQNSESGIPVQRPLFMHYEDDEECYKLQFEYLLGRDLLVAPVYKENANEWSLYIPEGEWIHLWTGKSYTGGYNTVASPLGYTPAFYRKDSKDLALFEGIREKYGKKDMAI